MPNTLIILVVFLVWYFLALPLQLGRKLKAWVDQVFEQTGAGDPRVPAQVRGYWAEAGEQLEALGFVPGVYQHATTPMRDTRVYVALFVNKPARDLVVVAAIWTKVPALRTIAKQYTVEFGTELLDGLEIYTGNMTVLPWRAHAALSRRWILPGMADLSLLYRLHQEQVSRHQGQKRALPADEKLADVIPDDFARDYQNQLEQNYVYLDAMQKYYRYTVKGQLLTVWSMMWPNVWIRRWGLRRRASAILEEAGMPVVYERADYSKLKARYGDEGSEDFSAEQEATAELIPAEWTEPKQSGLGIASFILGIFALAGVAGMFATVTIFELSPVESPDEIESNGYFWLGLAFLAAMGAGSLGFLLGIVAIFQKHRKKTFAIAGMCMCGLTGLLFSALLLLGALR